LKKRRKRRSEEEDPEVPTVEVLRALSIMADATKMGEHFVYDKGRRAFTHYNRRLEGFLVDCARELKDPVLEELAHKIGDELMALRFSTARELYYAVLTKMIERYKEKKEGV